MEQLLQGICDLTNALDSAGVPDNETLLLSTLGICLFLLFLKEREVSSLQLKGLQPPIAVPQTGEVAEPEKLQTDPIGEKEPQGKGLARGLARSRSTFLTRVKGLFTDGSLPSALLEELQAVLIQSDLGVSLSEELVESVNEQRGEQGTIDEKFLLGVLQERIGWLLRQHGEHGIAELALEATREQPHVLLIVGVNGVGKTTTSAKIAAHWQKQGHKVLLVAGDTFRAAAVAQLQGWGERLGIPVYAGADGAKPSTVVFDALTKAKREGFDAVIIDTAGRLHTKSNLMQELSGTLNSVRKQIPSAPDDTILVIDGTTGQNALIQARKFNEATELSGVIVTKLDGTAKGGIVVAVSHELGIPVRAIGIGEGVEDLLDFDPEGFAQALISEGEKTLSAPSAHGGKRLERRKVG